MNPKKFNFSTLDEHPMPLSQDEYLRSPSCPLLIKSPKCSECLKKEVKLRSQHNAKRKASAEPVKPNAPLTLTSPDRLQVTVQHQRQENKLLKNQNLLLSEKLQAALEKDSVAVDDEISQDFVDIFKGVPGEKVAPFMRLFWEEQQRYLRTQDNRQIRYHPAIIKYCLSIAAKSSSVYEQLRLDTKDGTGILQLPSQRTLRKYRNYITPQQGFNPQIIKDLEEKTRNFSDSERYVSILIDEMKVQEDLVFDKNSGKLIGFVDFGDEVLNESMLKSSDKLATHIMVFIVKSIKNPLSFSFANFATEGAVCSQIYGLFWKAVDILEISCHLKVVATVADGASTNRKFVKMNSNVCEQYFYNVLEKITDLFLFCIIFIRTSTITGA